MEASMGLSVCLSVHPPELSRLKHLTYHLETAIHHAKGDENVWAVGLHCWREFRADILTGSE